jgi:glycosyltransferase involved in cell wall biosynthesis
MKKVCIVRQKYYPTQRNLRRNAETLSKAGYKVDVICLGRKGQKKRESINGVNVHRIIMPHRRGKVLWYLFDYTAFFIRSAVKLTWLSLKKRYDVIEVHTMPDFLVFITLLPKLLGSKVILFMFENTPELFISSFNTGPNHIVAKILRVIEKVSASYADYVLVSDGFPYKEVLESRGIPSEKITVILNVPDDVIFDPKSVPANRNREEHFRLIIVSTLVERYGVQTLVKAVPLLVKEIPNLIVDVLGEGEYRPYLEEMGLDLGVTKYLNFTGFVRYEDVPAYIARAHIGIAPMIADVGAPNKIFEYFAMGKPSIASAQPGLVKVFNNGCVLYFQAGNEKELAARILELYHSPEKRASLGSNGQAVHEEYRWSILKLEYLNIYNKVLDKRHNGNCS